MTSLTPYLKKYDLSLRLRLGTALIGLISAPAVFMGIAVAGMVMLNYEPPEDRFISFVLIHAAVAFIASGFGAAAAHLTVRFCPIFDDLRLTPVQTHVITQGYAALMRLRLIGLWAALLGTLLFSASLIHGYHQYHISYFIGSHCAFEEVNPIPILSCSSTYADHNLVAWLYTGLDLLPVGVLGFAAAMLAITIGVLAGLNAHNNMIMAVAAGAWLSLLASAGLSLILLMVGQPVSYHEAVPLAQHIGGALLPVPIALIPLVISHYLLRSDRTIEY